MRIKTRACRAGISKIPPKPSSMTVRVLGHLPSWSEVHPATSIHVTTVNEAECGSTHGVVPETSSYSDDRKHDCLSPSSSDKTIVLTKRRRNSASDVSFEKHWQQKKTCIKCDKGGQVLVCSESGCPLAIHEKCMGCLASFDDMGHFYCPYCLYKRAAAESDQAREKAMLAKKALSNFIDRKIDGNLQKQKSMRTKRKEPHSSTSVRDRNYNDNKNKLNSDEAPNQSLQAEDDLREGASALDCKRSLVPIKGVKVSLGNEQNDVLFGRHQDNANLANCDHQPMIVVEQETCPKISVPDGSDNCGPEGTTLEEDPREDASAPDSTICLVSIKGFEASFGNEKNDVLFGRCGDNAKVANCNQPTTVVGQEICPKIYVPDGSDNCRQEETTPANESFQASITKGEINNAENSETHQFVVDDVGKIQVEHSGQVDDHHCEEVVEDQLQAEENVDPARKCSSELKTTAEENAGDRNKKVITSNKSRQLHEPSNLFASSTFLNARRKKLPWTTEEEEMLKEGVQKFSTTVRKNLPWRKILEFGSHVFHQTRTPVDLKDKWRNILGKESSAISRT